MRFYVLTLFPDMIVQGMQTSIFGRAVKNGRISLEAVDIRNYTENKHKKVDDYPYGGGAGMLMQAQPVFDTCRSVKEKAGMEKTRVIYLTPQGKAFTQEMAQELAEEKSLIFLCGHYEGIDERVLEETVTDYVSVGDFVLTGGELPAMVMMDAISRLIPGVLNNEDSADFETFHNDLLEYPQYSRPEEWHGKKVPAVLLSGNHAEVEKWRLEQSMEKTKKNRPDLYEKYSRKQYFIEKMRRKNKWMYMDIMENLRRGRGTILYGEADGIVVCDRNAGVYFLAAFEEAAAAKIAASISQTDGSWLYVLHQDCLLSAMQERFCLEKQIPFRQAVYTQKVSLSVSGGSRVSIQQLSCLNYEEVVRHYSMTDDGYIRERLASGNIYGAFLDEKLTGFAGIHREGSLGILEVYEEYRHQGIGTALEAFLINRHLSCGYTPYASIEPDNIVSRRLQEKLGLHLSKEVMYWVSLRV